MAKVKLEVIEAAPPSAAKAAQAWLNGLIERGREAPFALVADITPDRAAAMLERNEHNRHLNPTIMRQLASDIKGGRWQFNGEAIIFAESGELNDGQHRLGAAVETGTAIQAVCVFGVDRESRMTLDMGRMRSAGDYLHLQGTKNAMLTAAITRLVLGWERSDGRHFDGVKHVTISEQIARAQRDKHILAAADYAAKNAHYAGRLITGSALGFCHVVLSRINSAAAESYLDQVCVGEGLRRGDPAFVVRERLLTEEKRTRTIRIAMVLRGWQFFRDNALPPTQAIHGRGVLPELK